MKITHSSGVMRTRSGSGELSQRKYRCSVQLRWKCRGCLRTGARARLALICLCSSFGLGLLHNLVPDVVLHVISEDLQSFGSFQLLEFLNLGLSQPREYRRVEKETTAVESDRLARNLG